MVPNHVENLDDSTVYLNQNQTLLSIDDGYYQHFSQSDNIEVSLNWMPSGVSNLTYEVFDDDVIRYSGTLDVVVSESKYTIPVNHHVISPCLCIIEIKIYSDIGLISVDRMIIQANEDNSTDSWLSIPSTDFSQVTESIFGFDSVVSIPNEQESFLIRSSIISQEDNYEQCEHGIITEESFSITNFTFDEVAYNYQDINDGKVPIQIETTLYEDGWKLIVIQVGDGNNWSSEIGCFSTKLDLIAPIISIDSPTLLEEKIGLLIVDASSSYDPKWGRNQLQYFWSLQNIDDSYSVPVTVKGDDNGIFTVDATNSGTFQINLTLIDSASHSSSQTIIVTIENIRPQANMRIESVPVTDGQIIRLTNQNSWNVDASYSYDSQNDFDNLTYTWFLDGKPIMSGIDRVLTRPENVNDMHELTLMVEDNDGAVDWVTVTIGIAGTPSDPNEPSSSLRLIAGISIVILFCTIIIFVIITRNSSRTPNIRQWNSSSEQTTESRIKD